jgi:hypothetical protein
LLALAFFIAPGALYAQTAASQAAPDGTTIVVFRSYSGVVLATVVCEGDACDNVVWGNDAYLDSDNVVWGNDSDNVVWGNLTTLGSDNVVWGNDSDNVVWGNDSDNVVWGNDSDNVVWGNVVVVYVGGVW